MVRGVLRQVGADISAEHAEGQPRSAGRVAGGHAGVAVLFDVERVRPLVLDRVAESLQRADPGIAAPREGQLGDASGTDQLVVDDVGCHAHEMQVAALLADDLVTGGMRDQMGETLERQRVAVVHVRGNGLTKST